MALYKGYFRGFVRVDDNNKDGDLYCVYIGGDKNATQSGRTFEEIKMSDTPLIVRYEESSDPFAPVRKSTATISFVNNSYMEDILPSSALECPVYVYNEDESYLAWCGYLTPRTYDANYSEEYETVELEAIDCLTVLQYIDYKPLSGNTKNIAYLHRIIGSICDATKIIDRFYWDMGKTVDGNELSSSNIMLSEQNFFSSDTDEPWKMSEVIEEICRYFGLTVIQQGKIFYFIDYLTLKLNNQIRVARHFAPTYNLNGYSYLNANPTHVTADMVRSDNATISMEPVYNKCVVKDNMYTVERLIPSVFDDEFLENRLNPNNFYEAIELSAVTPDPPTYPYGSAFLGMGTGYHKDGEGDTKYTYYMRVYDHKDWMSSYDNGAITDKSNFPKTQTDLQYYRGGTIVDFASVRNTYISEYGRTIVPSKLDYTRYLMINQQDLGAMGSTLYDYTVFYIPEFKNNCPYDPEKSYLVINCSAMFEKYPDRCYINPDWDKNSPILGGFQPIIRSDGRLKFVVKVGDKYWKGNRWVTGRTGFNIILERPSETYGFYNESRGVLNNVHYSLGLGLDGYSIPLSGTNVNDTISIEVLLPSLQTEFPDQEDLYYYNGYCWIKDFDIKIAQIGQEEADSDSDVVYENVINDSAVNEIKEIPCRLTTAASGVSPSYSTVLYARGNTIKALNKIKDNSATSAREPENNIIQKYVDEFSTPTKKINLTLDLWESTLIASHWDKFFGVDVENTQQLFVEIGREVNYKDGTINITLMELK